MELEAQVVQDTAEASRFLGYRHSLPLFWK